MTTPPPVVRAMLGVTCKDLGDRVIETTVSTASTDHMGDQITQSWDLTAYRRNPVVFWNHKTQDLPIAKSIWIGVVNGQLRSRDQFPPPGMYPFADTVHDMAAAGFINAKSVGFKPQKWVHNEQRGGIDYLENLLLEHSYVGLPANPEALIAGRTADRVAVGKWLDDGGRLRLVDDGEPVLHIIDAAPALFLELAEERYDVTPEEIRAVFAVVIAEQIEAEIGRLKGNADFSPSRPVGRGRR